jgi:hypothetical protein
MSWPPEAKGSQASYAANFARVEEIPFEEALTNASEQFQKLVPDGAETVGQSFFDVFDEQSSQKIGFIWRWASRLPAWKCGKTFQ